MNRFLATLLAQCPHDRESFPMTLPGERGAHRSCLDCGKRYPCKIFGQPKPEQPQGSLKVECAE